MILGSLNRLYDRLARDRSYLIAPPGYSLQQITFKVVLSRGGELVEFQDARYTDHSSLRAQRLIVPGSTKSSGSGLNPGFLWDNTGYLLGFAVEDTNPKRTKKTFAALRDKHLALESEIRSAAFSAVCRFLEHWDPACAPEHPVLGDAGRTGYGVFQLQGETAYVHQDPAVVRWWEGQLGTESQQTRGQCLVTGQDLTLARLHPKIKGVAGAQTAGATIVGFNEEAYESYGKKQSYNAPVSEDVAFRYVTGLNALLSGPMSSKHRFMLGGTTVAFWTERPTMTEDIFAQFLSGGSAPGTATPSQDEGLRQKLDFFLEALREGREVYAEIEEDPEHTPFFLLGLAPNAGRISVRFFHSGTLAELLQNLRQHHLDISIVRRPAGGKGRADPEFPAAWLLLRQTAREANEIPPLLAAPLLGSIIRGTRYPDALYAAVLRRIKADGTLNYARACVIKGYLIRNQGKEVSVSLDAQRTDPAYRLGRLFAALEKTQKDALGENLNKTIRDSFYSSASATPGSVFPRLLRNYQHHLAKLEGGRRVNREKLVQEIVAPLASFPGHLDLADQGAFAIGYYHQSRDFYTKRERNGKASDQSEGDNDEPV